MAKANVTRKWVNNNFKCCSVDYCELQNLLYFQNPSFYTCGVYGWNFDVYTFGNYAITTGYRSMIDDVRKDYYDLIREYDSKARKLLDDRGTKNIEEVRKEVNELLKEFLSSVFDTQDTDRFCIY